MTSCIKKYTFFLHNWSRLFFWHDRSHFTFTLCSMLMSPKLALFAIFNRLLVRELNQSVVVSCLQNYCFYNGHYRHYGLKLTLLHKATVSMEKEEGMYKPLLVLTLQMELYQWIKFWDLLFFQKQQGLWSFCQKWINRFLFTCYYTISVDINTSKNHNISTLSQEWSTFISS